MSEYADTIREYRPSGIHAASREKFDAALAALERERDEAFERWSRTDDDRDKEFRRAERAETALRDAIDVAVWLTGLGEIPADSAWPEMRAKLNAAMQVLLDAGIPVGEPEVPA